jgi:Flp pilus assembly protein TadG
MVNAITKRFSKLARDEDGAAVVEFALVMPILALIVFCILDLGRAFYTVNNLVSAVREGARYGAVLADPGSTSGQLAIKNRVRTTFPPFGSDTLTNAQIEVVFPETRDLVTVRVTYPFRPLTPIAEPFGLGTWSIVRQATFRWERGA